ncbi:MAG TPA: outer membrane beta-barrel protein [Chitinophagaceae bacterium]|nr:outer membrane beta-barrel protein [Chitinophagaceae bacterium]
MKKIQIAIYVLAACLVANSASAQEGILKLRLDYAPGIPLGSFKTDAVNQTAWRGYSGDLMYYINDRWAVGGASGFQDFYQKYPRQVYKGSDNSDISAVLTNSIQTMPLLAKGQFSILGGTHTVKPYVALGVGGNFITYRQFTGEYDDSKTAFGFAAAPELGVNIAFGPWASSAGLNVGAAYNYMPFNYAGLNNLNNLALRLGINIPFR